MKTKRYNHGYFYDHTWRANIHVVWNVDNEGINEFCKKQFGILHECRKPFDGRALEIVDNENTGVGHAICIRQWAFDAKGVGILAHECLHVAHQILSQRGIKFTDDTVECYTYLVESLVRRSLEILPIDRRRKY